MSTRNDSVKRLLIPGKSTLAGVFVIAVVLTAVLPEAFAASPDFVISAPYPPGSVQPGTTIATTIYVNSTGGFAGTVNLSVAASPAGIQVSIIPSVNIPVGGSNNAQLTITTNSAPPATYSITITGVSGSIVHSINTLLVVLPPPPSFSVMANPSSMILNAGDSALSTLTITSLYGFAGTVSLSVEVRPQVVPWPTPFNATASVAPSSVTISPNSPASATVQIQTAVSTPTGQYSVWVWALGSGQTHQAFIRFGVGPYFTMVASPSSLSVPASTTGTSMISLTSHANFSFTANFQLNVYLPGPLECSPCPIYPQVTINPSTVNLPAFGGGTTSLTIATAANTTQGTYTIYVYGGGCVCLLPTTTITATVTSPPPPGGVNQTVTFDGVKATLTGSLTTTNNSVSGSITVTATNATTGAIIFSKTFTIAFAVATTNNPRFVMIVPVTSHTLGITCSVSMSNTQSSCFLSRDPDASHIGTVNMIDVAMIFLAYGTVAGTTNYNPALDLADQGTVNMVDISIIAADFNAPVFA